MLLGPQARRFHVFNRVVAARHLVSSFNTEEKFSNWSDRRLIKGPQGRWIIGGPIPLSRNFLRKTRRISGTSGSHTCLVKNGPNKEQ